MIAMNLFGLTPEKLGVGEEWPETVAINGGEQALFAAQTVSGPQV